MNNITEQVKELDSQYILKVSHWNGLHYPNTGGLILTRNKELYSYSIYYNRYPTNMKEEEANYLTKLVTLNDQDFNTVIDFIESHLLKAETGYTIMDASMNIDIKYNGINKTIENNEEEYNNINSLLKTVYKEPVYILKKGLFHKQVYYFYDNLLLHNNRCIEYSLIRSINYNNRILDLSTTRILNVSKKEYERIMNILQK